MIHQRFAALELIDDLEFLTAKLGEVHPDPFFALPQVEFLQRAEAIKASLHDEMTPIEFFEQAAGLLAALNDEHTWLEIPTEEHGDSVFPVDLVFCGNEEIGRAHV
jgi:hypothetical protein